MKGYRKLEHTRLAEGEVTGHHHTATGLGAVLWESSAGSLVLEAPGGARVVHQEHDPICLEPGRYRVVRVREYDHFAEEAREVRD